MASVPRSSGSLQPRSGGKIVRTRRTWRSRTPYDRPSLSTVGHEENPNWISRLVLSPTLMIATGAGKLLSSVFRHESSSSSSSGSDSEEETEDEDEDEDNCNQVTYEGFEASKKNQTSEMDSSIRKEVRVGRNESKRLIEQLLMQETFSREECDRFMEILKSRVIESANTVEADEERLTETPKKAVGNDGVGPDLRSSAVLEARKWLSEKRSGSYSKLEFEQGNDDVVNEEFHSPVDVAKSYMEARPRWASPFINHLELKSPPPGIQLFMEETKYSIGESSLPSSKLRKESPATGSWNIKEELRRVRSKATEEMLRNLPSKKIDWSSFASGNNCSGNSIGVHKQKTCCEEEVQGATRTEDAPLIDSTAMPVLDMTLNESVHGALLPDSNGVTIQQNEDAPTNLTIMGKSDEEFCHVLSSYNGQEIQKEHEKLAKEQSSNPQNHDDTMCAAKMPAEERCELLSEASVEVPNVNESVAAGGAKENESMGTASQNSTSMQYDELWKPNTRRIGGGRGDGQTAQSGRKPTRYNRKVKSRGK